MDRIADFRRHAETAEAFAARARDPKMRRLFLDIAEQWRALAGQLERADPRPAPPARRPR